MLRQIKRIKPNFSHKPVRYFNENIERFPEKKAINIRCLMVHPVFPENLGPEIELYKAEEAIGLSKTLNWSIIKGPFWDPENDKLDQRGLEEENTNKSKKPSKEIQRRIRDGDYIYLEDGIEGVFYKGGVIADINEDEGKSIYNEWKDVLLRESLAKSSLVKVEKIKSSTFFSKGRLNELCEHMMKNKINAIFVNTVLTSVQQRNLQIYINNFVHHKGDRIRAYNLKSALKEEGDTTATSSNFSMGEETYNDTTLKEDNIRIFDRFNIIISIFAQRAHSKISKLQIELAWLRYCKSRLARGGHANFAMVYYHFTGDLFSIGSEYEVVSAKQKGVKGTISGSGETQLEIEKRKIANRETKIKNELIELKKSRNKEREQRVKNKDNVPILALVGYTNSGKTAIMNLLTSTNLKSENTLFQTLETTIKRFILPNNRSSLLLDTIGFITDLPHELVESFKSTLEEIFNSDILLHIIDVSNPNYLYQRETVYKVLDEIFPDKNYTSSIIEVWNKIDLLENKEKLESELKNNDYTVIPISAKYCVNVDSLLNEIIRKTNQLKGRKSREIRIKDGFDETFNWIKSNIGNPNETLYDEQTNEMVIKIEMDDSQFNRFYMNFIERPELKQKK